MTRYGGGRSQFVHVLDVTLAGLSCERSLARTAGGRTVRSPLVKEEQTHGTGHSQVVQR